MNNNEVKEETVEIKEEETPKRRVVEDDVDDEFLDKKTKRDLSEKSMVARAINVLLWVVLIAWMGVCVWDFVNVKTDKDPMFCISKKTTTYEDGTVDTCIGLGYKVFNYDRDSFKGREFGPFWKKDRTADNK